MFRNQLNRPAIITEYGREAITQFEYIKKWMTKDTSGSYVGYERYMYSWIAFNVYYNLVYFKQNPEKTIEYSREKDRVFTSFKKLTETRKQELATRAFESCPNFIDCLTDYSIEGYDRKTKQRYNVVHALYLARENNNLEETLENLFLCLYIIRCNLFHGVKQPNDERQNRLLENSSVVLKRILTVFLEPFFLDR